MVGDTRHQQATQKFSFIESLDLSEKLNQQQTGSASSELIIDDVPASALTLTSGRASSIDTGWYSLDTADYDLDVAEIIQHCAGNNSRQSSPRSYWSKILFALACSYCLFVLWWLFGHQGSRILTALTGGKQIVLAKSDLQFVDYMERSLNNIDRKIAASKLDSGQDGVVYVPMYTPDTAQSQVSSLPKITSPEPIPPQALKIPAPPPLPAPTPVPETDSSPIATNIKPIKHTLTGILELGENQSAALVKIQGKTRRVWQGEQIGNSGWTLDSIGNQTAQISSNGKVRSISVGETF